MTVEELIIKLREVPAGTPVESEPFYDVPGPQEVTTVVYDEERGVAVLS